MEDLYKTCVENYKKYSADENKKNEYYSTIRKNSQKERLIAIDEAFDHITKNNCNSILNRAKHGFYNSNIYKFKRSDNIKFNNIYLSDLLRKDRNTNGDSELVKRLREHYAPFKLYIKKLHKMQTFIIEINWFTTQES